MVGDVVVIADLVVGDGVDEVALVVGAGVVDVTFVVGATVTDGVVVALLDAVVVVVDDVVIIVDGCCGAGVVPPAGFTSILFPLTSEQAPLGFSLVGISN